MKLDEVIAEAITQQDLDQLEIYADRLFAKVGIDVEFTRHFLDRVNDERNQKDITIGELTRLFKQEFKRWGKPIAQLGPDAEAVMKDMQTDINVPFVLKWDNKNGELDLVAKTVMRKKNFYTPDKEFPVEGYMTATPANPLAMMGQPSRSGVGKDSLGTLNVVSKSAQQDYDEYDQKQQAQDARQGALQSQIDHIEPAKPVPGLAQRKVKTNEESPWDMFKNAALPVVQKKFYDHAAKTLHSVLMRKKQENNLKHGLGYYAQQIAKTFDGMSWRALLKHYGEVYGDNVVTELKIERPDPADTMGVARDKMPQVKREDYPEFIDYLKDNGAQFSKETVGPRTLKPIQGEFSDAGVEKAITLNKVEKPIIASSDNYIIDGHHRWLAAINTGQDVLIYRVNIPGEQLLKLVLAFPKTYFKPISENFADGKVKGKSRPGRVKAAGASCDGSVTELRAKAKKASGEKAKMYHWCANMKAGRQKAESTVSGGVAHTGGWNQDATAQSNGWQGMTKSMRGSFNPNSNKNKNKSSWVGTMLQRAKDTVFGEDVAIIQLDAPTPTVFDIAKAHNVPVRQIQDQLAKGIKVEMEHTQDPKVAQEIALDHIAELPDYYDRLLFVEAANAMDGKEMLEYFNTVHHDIDNEDMDNYILAHDWELRDFTPDMFPSEEEFFDYDDPFDRVIDIDYSHRVDLSQPIIVGPQYSDGKYSVIDGNHRAAQAQQMGKTIKGYFPVKKVNETAGVGKIVKGVNTTVDVGTNEIQKQAKKWGFSVDKDGRPGLLMNAINNMGKKNGK